MQAVKENHKQNQNVFSVINLSEIEQSKTDIGVNREAKEFQKPILNKKEKIGIKDDNNRLIIISTE